MDETIANSAREFSCFIDGFRARNLASTQQKIKVQLSEMETRLTLLKSLAQSKDSGFTEFNASLLSIDAAFRDSSITIIDRLLKTSESINTLLRQQGEFIKEKPVIFAQLKAFLHAYIDAAEISRAPTLIDAAVALAKTYKALFSPPGNVKSEEAASREPALV